MYPVKVGLADYGFVGILYREPFFLGPVNQAAASKRAAQEKRRAEKRLNELDNLLAKIYEDRLNEKITERNFSMLSQKYQQEQGELEKKIEALTAQLASTKEQEDGINKWVELIKQFSSPTESNMACSS